MLSGIGGLRLHEKSGRVLAKVVELLEFLRSLGARFAAELLKAGSSPETDREIDRLLRALNTCLDEAPLTQEEKLVALYVMLTQLLADIEDENERRRYVDNYRNLLRWDLVEATVKAFRKYV